MTVSTLKDLEKLVKLMRKVGIDKIKVDSIELELGDVPQKLNLKNAANNQAILEDMQYRPGGIDQNTRIETPDDLTPEQLLFYSSQGIDTGMG